MVEILVQWSITAANPDQGQVQKDNNKKKTWMSKDFMMIYKLKTKNNARQYIIMIVKLN